MPIYCAVTAPDPLHSLRATARYACIQQFRKGRFEYFWHEGLIRLVTGDTRADCRERSPHSRREASGRRCRKPMESNEDRPPNDLVDVAWTPVFRSLNNHKRNFQPAPQKRHIRLVIALITQYSFLFSRLANLFFGFVRGPGIGYRACGQGSQRASFFLPFFRHIQHVHHDD